MAATVFGNRKSQIANRKSSGAVATELSLLVVFVYLPLVIGSMYIAWLALARGRVHEANHFALHQQGNQSELSVERGRIANEFFEGFTGDVIVVEGAADAPEVPMPGEVRDLFEEYVRQYHWRRERVIQAPAPSQPRPPRAWGGFTLGGGGVSYEEHVDPGVTYPPATPPPEPRIVIEEGSAYAHASKAREVMALGLLDDDIPEHLTRHMVDFMGRHRTQAVYRHRWLHDRDPVVAGSGGRRKEWLLQVPAPEVKAHDEWSPEGATRGTKVRQSREYSPPGADMRSLLQCPVSFPGYETDVDFMHPK